MKAIRYNEPRNFRYEDVATPKPVPLLAQSGADGVVPGSLVFSESQTHVPR